MTHAYSLAPHAYFTDVLSPVRIFIVDGNIGSGKSSLFQALASDVTLASHGFLFVPEPVSSWASLLELYYADPLSWQFHIQMHVFLSTFTSMSQSLSQLAPDSAVRFVVFERSFESVDIFSECQEFHEKEKELLWLHRKTILEMNKNEFPECTKHFYLECSTETCQKRIMQRSRSGEEKIEIEYLKKLKEAHERYIARVDKEKVTRVDAEQSKEQVVTQVRTNLLNAIALC